MELEKLLNPQQLKGVYQTEGAVLVIAGAGSGKTRVLTYRIAYLIEKGVSPFHILAITFTNKATNEMKERVLSLCPTGQGVWISTFHAFCARVLRQHIELLGYTKDFSIYDDVEQSRVVKKILKNKQLDEKAYLAKCLWHISNAKNKGLSPDKYIDACSDLQADVICEVYERYDEALRLANALDYDDLLLKTVVLFGSHPEVLQYYQDRFQYVHIDEYQDTNCIQYLLVKMLVAVHGNLFAVGDEDQSIYAWRGADINNILDFRKDFPQATVIKLEQNYRSTGNILAASNVLIQNNRSRFAKKLWTDAGDGESVVVERKNTDSEEAEYVVNLIATQIRQGAQPKDFAILVRLNALTGKFEERLNLYNIPYKVFGGFKFFERKEIKDVLAYLRILCNPRDTEALLRVINTPKRGIGDTVVAQLVQYADARSMAVGEVLLDRVEDVPEFAPSMVKKLVLFRDLYYDLFRASTEKGVAATLKYIIDKAGFALAFAGEDEELLNKRLNLDELVQIATEFENDNPNCVISDFLQSVSLSSDADDIQEDNFVSLATVHAVKGLEFPVVFVVGLEDNVFPSGVYTKTENEIEEERRVMYVAMTRAQKKLYLTYAQSRFRFGRYENNPVSRFVTEIMQGMGWAAPRAKPQRTYTNTAPQAQQPNLADERYTAQYKAAVARPTLQLRVGDKVTHPKFGKGMVIACKEDNATVAFEAVGVKILNIKIAPLSKL